MSGIVYFIQPSEFISSDIYKIGYSKVLNKNRNKNIKLLTSAFQRRFRQYLVNGIIDEECLLISKNLTKNLK